MMPVARDVGGKEGHQTISCSGGGSRRCGGRSE